MDEKTGSKEDDDQARERQAAELQAQIEEIISGKADTKPKTLRDLTRIDRDLIPAPAEKSEESECENGEG